MVLCLLSTLVLPSISNYINSYTLNRLDKYVFLSDNFVYRDDSIRDYHENINHFDEDGSCIYYSELSCSDDKNFLLIICNGNPTIFGIPYFDTYINFDYDGAVTNNCYYTNIEGFLKPLMYKEHAFYYGDFVNFAFPTMNPFLDLTLEENVVVCFTNFNILDEDTTIQATYDLNKLNDIQFEYDADEIGKNIKENYLMENRALVSFSSRLMLLPCILFFLLIQFGSFLLSNRLKKEMHIKKIYFQKPRLYMFIDLVKIWTAIIVLPLLGGYALSVIVRIALDIMLLTIMDYFIFFSILIIPLIAILYQMFFQRGEYEY